MSEEEVVDRLTNTKMRHGVACASLTHLENRAPEIKVKGNLSAINLPVVPGMQDKLKYWTLIFGPTMHKDINSHGSSVSVTKSTSTHGLTSNTIKLTKNSVVE